MERDDYTAVAKSLHWLIALLIFIQFPLGWFMDSLSGLQKFQAFNWHKSIGITVLALMALRLVWRLLCPVPTLPSSMPKLERIAAHLGHFALYVVIFLVTLAGWSMISASDKPSVLFQSFPFPMIPWLHSLSAEDKKAYAHLFGEAHEFLGYLLLMFIAIHVAAALRHAFLLKDGILARMLPRFGGSKTPVAIMILPVALGFWIVGSSPAQALEWSVNPQKSQICFEASGSGYTANGAFNRYKAEIEFDPDIPEQTVVNVLLDMHSVSTGTTDVDQTLQSADFFDPAKYPTAQFVARSAKLDGDGKYVLNGRLTLKGITKPISLPFSIDIKSGNATVKAETVINRLEFGVGPESVAGLAVDKNVKLTINLTAVKLTD